MFESEQEWLKRRSRHLVQIDQLKGEFPQHESESEHQWLKRLRRRLEKRQHAASLAARPAAVASPAAVPRAAAPPAAAPLAAAPPPLPAWYVPGWRSRSSEEIEAQRNRGDTRASYAWRPIRACDMCGQCAHGDCGCIPQHVLLGEPGPSYEPCCPSDPHSPCYDPAHDPVLLPK